MTDPAGPNETPQDPWPRAVGAILLWGNLLLLGVVGPVLGQEKSRPPVDAPKDFEEKIKPLLSKFCFSCHNPEKKKGELDLTAIKTYEQALGHVELWQKAVERVNAFEMPPKKAPQPSFDEKGVLGRWYGAIPKGKLDCNQLATDRTQRFYKGYAMSRRLSRREYENSLRDLLGLDPRWTFDIPADGSGGEGFDNNGDALFTSPLLLEKYLGAADQVLGAILSDSKDSPSPEIQAARLRVLGTAPEPGLAAREAARRVLGTVAWRAFRRPVSGEEVERYLAMFDRAQERGDSYFASLRLGLKGILISPQFLFLVEPEPKNEGVYALGPHPLAQRLSYFLWSSLPDDELLRAAAQGKLGDDEGLRAEVRRMLRDPRSRSLGESFACQWLELEPLGKTVRPDSKLFPAFDEELAEAMKAEAAADFHELISQDRSLLELIDCDWTYVNERLAKLYGIPGIQGSLLRKVTLEDRNRGGVVGLAAVLTVSSQPLRTSPVLRGRWLLESLLGSKVPPPPPDAGTLPEPGPASKPVSFRERMEKHRTKPECASCHAKMDPLGFGLENFDPIGRWRAEVDGLPVDATGQLPSGERFTGTVELKKLLMSRHDEVMTHLARKLLGYALGRALNTFDKCVVEDSLKALQANGYRASALVETIALSYPFRHRYAKK